MYSFGDLLARLLAGSWRPSPPPSRFSTEELKLITPPLLESGAGALGWWCIRSSPLRESYSGLQLQEAYRLHTLEAVVRQTQIKAVLPLFRSAGVDPVIVKGWAVARYYAEEGLRPYGDIDLCVHPQQRSLAVEVLRSPEARRYPIDLHNGFANLDGSSADDLFGRSHVLKLGEMDVRVLAPEDHLRVLCLHLLRHGAFRPLWLCDIGAAVENRPAGFDWDLCLGANPKRANWVACSVGLAHRLLGADLAGTPVSTRAQNLPRWLVPAVIKQWERPGILDHTPAELMLTSLRHPTRVPGALLKRWRDPIEATFRVNGPFNELPRLPFQICDYLAQGARFVVRLPGLLRQQDNARARKVGGE